MRPPFADTAYFVAIVSSSDAAHTAALGWSLSGRPAAVTTDFVLVEVANEFCAAARRGAFRALLSEINAHPGAVTVVPASRELFQAGVDLYLHRPDKDWSLTDCISFVVMGQRGLTEALTTDHHFEQAGFQALLK